MAVRMTKDWAPLTEAAVGDLPGQLGVYQIADAAGRVVFIGFAGGRSLFGLRGVLQEEQRARAPGHWFRVEITMAYLTRHRELLMVHIADHGAPPPDNADALPEGLGRLSPAGGPG